MPYVYGALAEWRWQGKTAVLREEPVPVPPCPPQILHRTATAHWRLKYSCNMIRDVTKIDAQCFWRHKKSYQLEVLGKASTDMRFYS